MHAFWLDDGVDQQTGLGELQAAGLELCLAEDFATAGHLSLSPASNTRHHCSQFLQAHVTKGVARADLCENATFWLQEAGIWLHKMDEPDLAPGLEPLKVAAPRTEQSHADQYSAEDG